MFDKIDVQKVVSAHGRTLVNEATGKAKLGDYVLFYIIPLVAGAVLVCILPLRTVALQAAVGAFSIFSALLLNMLVIMFNLAKDPGRFEYPKDQARLVKQTQANIGYTILFGIVMTLVVLALLAFLSPVEGILTTGRALGDLVAGIAVYGGVAHFVLCLFMIIKRVTILLGLHADSASSESDPT